MSCPEREVFFVTVPWAEPGISYTKRCEADVIDLLKVVSYIKATMDSIPDAGRKTAFYRSHVVQILGKAVSQACRAENRALMREGDDAMVGIRFHWLSNRSNLNRRRQRDFAAVRRSTIQKAKAWTMKGTVRGLWAYETRGWAAKDGRD